MHNFKVIHYELNDRQLLTTTTLALSLSLSLAPGKRQCCVLDVLERRLVETQKIRPGTMHSSDSGP